MTEQLVMKDLLHENSQACQKTNYKKNHQPPPRKHSNMFNLVCIVHEKNVSRRQQPLPGALLFL